MAADGEESIVPPLAVKVKPRFEVWAVPPTNLSVPPSTTRLPAALVAWPRLPATPPLPKVANVTVPLLKVVTPV